MNQWVELLNGIGRCLLAHLLPLSVELAILAAAVLAVLALLRPRSSAIRHLFWCLVLVKPLTSLLVASPVSRYGVSQPTFSARGAPASFAADARGGFARTAHLHPSTMTRTDVERRFAGGRAALAGNATLDLYGLAALGYLLVATLLGLRLLLGCACTCRVCATRPTTSATVRYTSF
ncbi:MAG: hypothetical protein KKB50_02215 [Planctomycetes bacterium]|nr:hypothetical protein [Planctomycetota bacterium]